MGVLDEIVVGVRADLAERKARTSWAELERRLADLPPVRPVLQRLRAPELSVIAEVKRQSPSKGALADIADPAALATEYAGGGATAISVLTEQRRFGGSLADLRAVRAAVDTPILRKDFIVEPYQLLEARVAGADIALLIVASLTDAKLAQLYDFATELGLAVLVEAHTAHEIERALDLGPQILGINNRNLQTLDVDLSQFERLADRVPGDIVKVAESGIFTTADVERVVQAGADAILVGEALVRGGDPRQQVADFIAAGTAGRQAENTAKTE